MIEFHLGTTMERGEYNRRCIIAEIKSGFIKNDIKIVNNINVYNHTQIYNNPETMAENIDQMNFIDGFDE